MVTLGTPHGVARDEGWRADLDAALGRVELVLGEVSGEPLLICGAVRDL
jgi:hypothetical protein